MPSARPYDWLTTALLGRMYRRVAAEVASGTPPGTRVLEVGAGTGALAAGLVHLGIAVTATDLDPAMVHRARRRLRGTALAMQADAAALPFQDASYDLVLATLTVHHWPDIPAASSEIARVLRPGGKVLVWEPAKDPTGVHPEDRLHDLGLKDPRLTLVSNRVWPWPLRMRLLRRMEYSRN